MNWHKGDKALVDVPSPLPAFAEGWDDWADQVRIFHLKEVLIGEGHWYDTTYGHYVSGEGHTGVWVPKSWLSVSPWKGGEYHPECGGIGRHRLGCPTLKPRKEEY